MSSITIWGIILSRFSLFVQVLSSGCNSAVICYINNRGSGFAEFHRYDKCLTCIPEDPPALHFLVATCWVFFSLRHFGHFLLRQFGHWDTAAICLAVVLNNSSQQCSLAYIFRHSDRNDLIFFGHIRNISVYDRIKRGWKNQRVKKIYCLQWHHLPFLWICFFRRCLSTRHGSRSNDLSAQIPNLVVQ